jgi:hypothetical protein
MVGLTIHEVMHGKVWSDHVWKLLEPVFSRIRPRETVGLQKLVFTGEDIYVDYVADQSILGEYVEKARNEAWKEVGNRLLGKGVSLDELIYIWWRSAWGDDEGYIEPGYEQPLERLRQLTHGLEAVAQLGIGITDKCHHRARLYSEAWQSLADDVPLFKIIDKQMYWYPSSPEADEKQTAPMPGKQQSGTPLSPSLSERIQIQLAAYSTDMTPIIRHVVGSDDEEIAPTSRWDFNIPAHPLIDRRLVARLSALFSEYAERRKVVSRGLDSGKLDRRRLHRAATTGRCFAFVDRVPSPEWTITLLLDASGSMRGNKWKIVENTVGNLYSALANAMNKLQVYAYFETDGVCMISSLAKGRHLLSVPPGGKTASGQAIIAAAYLMPRIHKRNLLVHITDGETNFGCDVRYGMDYCREQNIHLVTLGCGCKDQAAMFRQYGNTIQFIDHFGQLPGSIENLLKRTFVYGKKPDLWCKHTLDVGLGKETAYANQ